MILESIREDFPVFKESNFPIYFDSACVTLRPIQVIEKINEYYKKYPACAGRSLHKLGERVTKECFKAREIIARFINAKRPEEIIFTKNTTEAINLVANTLDLKKEEVVLTTDKEHNSNLLPWQILSKEKGIIHKVVPSKEDNTFDLEAFKDLLDKKVKLVSMVLTSNLDGVTIPVKEIIRLAHQNHSLVMLDGAQAVGHRKVDVQGLDVDFLAFSGHKMLGPSGIGVLYGKYHLLKELSSFLVGGDTVKTTSYTTHEFLPPPEKFEAGLQNYVGIIGLAEACKYLEKLGLENIENHLIELNKLVTEKLKDIEGLKIIGPKLAKERSGIFSFIIEGFTPHEIALILDGTYNIAIRSGQHCVHSWFKAKGIEGSARVSFYIYNTKKEVETFVEAINNIVKLK